ncbi:hypothetical protein [Propionibacterium sp.]|uniref:ImmA/IrrE family metallo-endopeptidase n=1 Tax=Propionibacterium sp. TaxID=1977903 RepID=UPI0039EC96FB
MNQVDHEATRQAMTEQVAAFIANPAGWPAAMAARALRLRSGHPAYSPSNHALIVSQLWSRFTAEGLDDDDAFDAAMRAAAEEIAPRNIWAQRGYVPTGGALAIWSLPLPKWVDPSTGKKVTKDTPGAEERRVFRIEKTYRAADVVNGRGETGEAAFSTPELPEGEAREVFERLAAWITGQGWTVERSDRDMAEDGWTAHASRRIVVHGGLAGWAAVGTLAHEIAHALLHGAEDERPYAGQHRGDIEAEAEAVAFGLLTEFGQGELARGSARYTAEWTRSPERVAIAYERSCHVLDALAAVATGAEDVTLTRSAKAERAQAKADNKALATALREAGVEPKGEAWRRAKAGEPIEAIAADLATAA